MLDPRAASGFTSAEIYAQTRPTYPDAAWDVLGSELALGDDAVVVDLAAGTGQVAGALRDRGAAVIAVEPVAEMRSELVRRFPGVAVLGGLAEALPLVENSVDTLVVGEAFHWLDVPTALEQIARVLRPGGGLGLLWNVATWTERDTPWLPAFRGLVASHKEAAGLYPAGDGRWRGHLERAKSFSELQHSATDHRQRLQPADFVAQVSSWSWVANMPTAARRRLLTDIEELVRNEREITIPYRTDLYWTRHRS